MKQIIAILIIVLSGSIAYDISTDLREASVDPYLFEDVINSTIEGLRSSLPDPLIIETLVIDLPSDGVLTGNGSVSNLEVTGIRGFQLTALAFNLPGVLNFTLVLPTININTAYALDVLVADLIPLYGDGKANIHISGATIEAFATVNIIGGISLSELRVAISVGDVIFDVHGLLNDEDFSLIVSSILNDVIAKFINEHQELLSDILSPIILNIINGILSGDTTTVAPITDVP